MDTPVGGAGEGHGDAGVPVAQGGQQAAQRTGTSPPHHRFRVPSPFVN